MILNVWTVTALFLAGVGFLLAVAAVVIASRGIRSGRPDRVGQELNEDRAHLLALVMVVLLGVRLIAWPHFYFLMRSYVPDLAPFGAMCTFGVTRVRPGLVLTLQWLKPLSLWVLGFWWLLALVDRRTAGAALLRARWALTVPLAALAAADCVLETIYLTSAKVGRPVTCCSQLLDTGAAIPGGSLPHGTLAPALVWVVYVLVTLAVAAAAAGLARRGSGLSRHGGLAALGAAVAGGAGLAVAHWAWHEVVAPRVLELPYHHCVYELLTDTPAMGLAGAMTLAGYLGLLWPLGLQPWRRRAPAVIAEVQRGVYWLCAVLLVSGLLVVGVHAV